VTVTEGRRRVVVTGVGLHTPAGSDVGTFWDTLVAGRCVAAPIEAWSTEGHPVSYACEVKDFDPQERFGFKEARRLDRAAQLGVAAAGDAVADAFGAEGVAGAGIDTARAGVVAGTGIGGLQTLEEQVAQYGERGPTRVSPLLVPMLMANATAGHVGIEHGLTGPNLCIATACAAGANAIGEAVRLIREGSCDVVVAGGTEAAVTPVATAAFWRMGALSTNPDPAASSRPFDVDRDGFVMGEGAAFLVLEERDAAVARGARIWGEILGYGRNCDAFHITAPAEGGIGAIACMEAALADAGLEPADVGHVNAHGTSTPLNDAAEAAAITKVFGAGSLPVTSTKGVTGHLVGAAGAVEAVASLLSIERGAVPPTANHKQLSEGLEVDVVAGSPRTLAAAPVVSNSFGFGGHNATLVFGPA
jgi:3-oxoacyl-[acyl-carrier-protein] synthase II